MRKQKADEELTLDKVAENYNKKYGDATVVVGGNVMRDAPRIPSGIFPVEYATGAGLPIWRSSCVWGPPSAGKSSLAARFMWGVANMCFTCFRLKWLCRCKKTERKTLKSVMIDVEGTFDKNWANALGLDDSTYYYVSPETGEQAVDIADSMVKAKDCGLVVIDSLAAITPSTELDGSAYDNPIALQARLVSNLFRRVTQRVIGERKENHAIAALFINQIRAGMGKGKMGGPPPEDQPSGYAAKFAYSMAMRVGARSVNPAKEKDKIDSRGGMALVAKTSLRINKHKLMVLSNTAEYEIVKGREYNGFPQGTILDTTALMAYARELGIIGKDGKTGYKMGAKTFRVLEDIQTYLLETPDVAFSMKQLVIGKAKQMEKERRDA